MRMLAGVFDIIPDPEGDAVEFLADRFVVLDCIQLPSPLDPPEAILVGAAATTIGKVFLGELSNPRRGNKRHRMFVAAGHEEDGAAEGFVVGHRLGEGFAVFRNRLAAHAEVGPGFEAETAVAGTVGKKLGSDFKRILGGISQRRETHDSPLPVALFDLAARAFRIEQQRDVRLGLDLFIEKHIPHRGAAHGIANGVLKAEFLDEA